MRKELVLLAIVAGLALARPGHAQDGAVFAACDAAAGAPASEDLPAGVPGVPPWKIDPKVAVPACEAAAKLAPDDGRIAYQLGRAYMAERSFGPAFAAFIRADERGYALGSFNLAAMYRNGHGVDADPVKARSLLEKSARGGTTAAVVRWLEKACADGDTEAMTLLARYYGDGWAVPVNHALAVEWFRKAAEAGHIRAMTALADHYRHGRGVPVSHALADEWLKKAADAGDPFAATTRAQLRSAQSAEQNRLGYQLMHGLGVKADPAQARHLFEKAAEAGDSYAMASLAWMYAEGRGVARDYVRAREWSEKAAALGHAMSMLMVGRAYDYGCGVAQDEGEARRWYEKARASVDSRARNSAEQALALLERPDIRRVRISQVRARGCFPPGPLPASPPR